MRQRHILAVVVISGAAACSASPVPKTVERSSIIPTARSAPPPIAAPEDPAKPTIAPAKRIALKNDGACAVLVDGGVTCWGGRETAPHRLEGASHIVDVAVGPEMAAVRADGTVLTYAAVDSKAPPLTLSLTGIQSIAADYHTACALHQDGTVSCFPNGFHDKNHAEKKPVLQMGVSNVRALGVSGAHACAIRGDGRLACWLLTNDGHAKLSFVDGVTDAVDIQVGPDVACARDKNRNVSCFFHAPHPKLIAIGQADAFALSNTLGDAPLLCLTTPSGVHCVRPETLGGAWSLPALDAGDLASAAGTSVTQVVAAQWAACLLDTAGTVSCWGDNINGLLGKPDAASVERPTLVPNVPKATALALGTRFSCAMSEDKKVYCWGARDRATNKSPISPRVSEVTGLGEVDRLFASQEHACVLDKKGAATCFYGPIDPNGHYSPVRVPALDGARAMRLPDLGFANIVAAIGPKGQLLVGPTPAFESLAGLTLTEVKGVGTVHDLTTYSLGLASSMGSYGFAIAAADDGHVYSVELGDKGVSRPTRVRGLDGAIQLQSGGFALLPGGRVVEARRLGDAVVTAQSSALTKLAEGGPCGLTADGELGCLVDGKLEIAFKTGPRLASAPGHQCEIDDAGAVRCQGANEWGQCGVVVGISHSDTPVDVLIQ